MMETKTQKLYALNSRIEEVSVDWQNSSKLAEWLNDLKSCLAEIFGPGSEYVYRIDKVSFSPQVVSSLTGEKDWRNAFNSGMKMVGAIVNEAIFESQHQGVIGMDTTKNQLNKIFVVHGHDHGFKAEVQMFIEKLDLKAVILHEQANMGQTVLEKFLSNSEAVYAVVLLSPDDVGSKEGDRTNLHPRARQNVVFELGYFIGRLGRERVSAIVKGPLEIPTDVSGMLYIGYDSAGAWRAELIKELKKAGIKVDANKAFDH